MVKSPAKHAHANKSPVADETPATTDPVQPPAAEPAQPAPAEVIEPVTLAGGSTLADPTPFLRAMNEAAKRLAKDGATLGVKAPEGAARKHLAAFLAECVGGEK